MTTVAAVRREFELGRLAAELGTQRPRLAALTDLDADAIAHLRRQLAAGLVAHHAAVFDNFARASTLVPAALAASITRRVIGSALSGRMAGSMSASRAAAIMGHLDAAFLADCCRTLSAAAAAGLIPAIDDRQITATTIELARRDDHATLGRFVDSVDDRRLALVLDVLSDPVDLLLAGAAVDTGAALDRVVAMLSADRRVAILTAAPARPDAAAAVLIRVTPASRGLLLAAAAELGDDRLVALLDALTGAIRDSAALRTAAGSLPGPEVAAAAGLLDRSEALQRALGRLAMAVLNPEEPA